MVRLFPIWARALGRGDVVLEGVDLKLHDSAEAYRRAVAQIKYDPMSIGALVTTHKIDLLDAARRLVPLAARHLVQRGRVDDLDGDRFHVLRQRVRRGERQQPRDQEGRVAQGGNRQARL